MKKLALLLSLLTLAHAAPVRAEDDFIDGLQRFLTTSAFDGAFRVRLSGLVDLEDYQFDRPAPGLLYSAHNNLPNARLSLFVDAQLGSRVYFFAQARVDRGFDPHDKGPEFRLDEYALRLTPWEDGRLSVQLGKFATIAGNWSARHLSWDNPFINAPLPYENVTGIWDNVAVDSVDTLLYWARVPYHGFSAFDAPQLDKPFRLPIIWGPSYATGLSLAGRLGHFEYAAEVKNASLSSQPEEWDLTQRDFHYPTVTARLGFRPNPMWNFGVTASTGSYLSHDASPTLPLDKDLGDYQQRVLGQDFSFEWHHLQIWAEVYEARFEVPHIAHADTLAYYVEAKYKITPQLFGALRWNEQLYGRIDLPTGERVRWGNDLWRIDAALGYRFTAHTQLKLQYSLSHEDDTPRDLNSLFAGQLTLKF